MFSYLIIEEKPEVVIILLSTKAREAVTFSLRVVRTRIKFPRHPVTYYLTLMERYRASRQ